MKKPTTRFFRWANFTIIALMVSCAGVQQDNRFTRSQRSSNDNNQTEMSRSGSGKTRAKKEPGKSYLAKSDEIAFELSAIKPKDAGASVSEIEGQSFSQALKAHYKQGETGPWMAVLKTDEVSAMQAGSQIVARFFARSVAPFNEDREAALGFYVYREKPWVQIASNRIIADDQWREYTVVFGANQDFKNGELSLAFDFGLKRQAVEVANIRMTDAEVEGDSNELSSTSSTYAGRSSQAEWRKAADKRIEQLRKGRLNLTLLDAKGNPIKNAKVNYRLKKHAFGFGTAVNKRLLAHRDTPDHQLYAQKVKEHFNKAVLENGMKWNQWESEIAPFLKEDTLKAMDWLENNGLEVRGNVLVWPGWDKQNPTDLRTLDKAALAKRIDNHIKDLAGSFKGRISEWDVVNESRTNTDFTDVLGKKAIADWFKLARQVDPGAKLYHNDFGILNGSDSAVETLEKTVASVRANGGKIDGLGLQAHFDNYLPSPERIIEVLDRLGTLDIELQATEFDVNVEDEQTQADFTRDFLTVMFSHPKVTGVTFWGFWEGQHWKPSCALYRKDWSIKPNGQVYLDLVNKKWTSKGSTKTSGDGVLSISGFQGQYEIIIEHNGKTFTEYVDVSKGTSAQFLKIGAKATSTKAEKPKKVTPQAKKPKPVTPKKSSPSKVSPTEPKAAPSKKPSVIKPPSVTLPKPKPKSIPKVAPKTAPAAPKTTPAVPKVNTAPKTAPAAPKTTPAVPKVNTAPKTAPAAPKTTPAVPKVNTAPKTAPAAPKTTPAVPKVNTAPKTAPSIPKLPTPNPNGRPSALQLPTGNPPAVPMPKLPTVRKTIPPVSGSKATPPATLTPASTIKPTVPKSPQTTPAAPKTSSPKPATPKPQTLPKPPSDNDAEERMSKLRERLRAAKERLAEKTKENETQKQ